jgi:nucleoside-diphosphate-sugar epimerase
LIHVEDAARAILFSLNSGREIKGGIYNVSDGSHFSRGEIVSWLADKLGLQATGFEEDDPPGSPDRKISIERIKTELKWTPLYNSFVKGYESILS